MTSIVIAAHNEQAVIGRCLDALLADARPDEFDVTVVANGCTDRTVEIAASRSGVRVLDITQASKPQALNAGDEAARGFPRVYLDADIMTTAATVRAVTAGLRPDGGGSAPAPLAAVPRRDLDLAGRPILVRGYSAINSRLPVFRDGLFGRGLIALSEAGRSRFDRFPDLVADDLFLDSQFTSTEKRHVDDVATVVAAPLRTRDLVRRLVRVRRGNTAMRAAGRTGAVDVTVRPANRLAWLTEVVIPRPWLAPAAAIYVGITAFAAVKARRSDAGGWGRDESTRVSPTEEGPSPHV